MRLPLVLLLLALLPLAASGTVAAEDYPVTAQTPLVTISGTIVDPSGEPIIGANIIEKGTTRGVVTDFDGNFSFSASANGTLVISYIGFITQELPIGNKRVFNVTLAEDSQTLSEVVVVGYGTMEKKQVTSSISSIKGDELLKGVGSSTIASALVGKITGLMLHESSSANAGATLQLRGVPSVNAGKSPLVVIDGMPGGDLRSVLPEDVASIDVLKDASAGAIYGTRATGGVILITTKSGEQTDGKVKFSYTGEMIAKQIYSAPEMLSASEYLAHERGKDYGADVNWWDEATQSKLSQRHIFSVQSGGKNSQIYASMSYEDLQGVKKFDESTRYSGRMNANFKLLDGWFEIKTHADYRQNARKTNVPNLEQALRNNPTRSPYDPESKTGYNVWLHESLDYNTIANAALYSNEGLDKWFKPDVTLKVNVLAVPGLSVQQTIGYENRQYEQHRYQSRYHKSQLENGKTGYAFLKFDKKEYLTSEGYASYINNFGKHSVNATAGYSYWERNAEYFEMSNTNFTNERVGVWDIGEGKFLKSGEAEMKSNRSISQKTMAYFGRANYSYDDKYMVTGTFRREGSSKFAEKHRWGNFWSLSGGWRISNESFMKDIIWVNDLKLRVGYGVTGNEGFNSDYAATLYGSDVLWQLPGGAWANSYGKSKNVNPDLKWEERKEWNFGLDYSLFNNRIFGKFDYFNKKTDDMIYEVTVAQPPYTQKTMHQNIGSMSSKGWEFEIGANIVQSKDWRYTTSMGFSRERTKIDDLWGNDSYFENAGWPAPGSPGTSMRMQEGSTFGQFYLWRFAGFDEEGGWLLYNKDGEVIPAKEKKIEDKSHVGNYTPDLVLNWNHSVAYKNFDLSVTMLGAFGMDIYNAIDMYMGMPTKDGLNVLKRAYSKYAHITGEKELCDFFLQDGSYFKIQNLNVGYTFDAKKYTNKFLDSARLYFTVNNVYTFTGYKGSDPSAIQLTGFEYGIDWHTTDSDNKRYFDPQARSYTIGLQVKF